MRREMTSALPRHTSRWWIAAVLLAAAGVIATIENTPWNEAQPRSNPHDFRKAGVSAAPQRHAPAAPAAAPVSLIPGAAASAEVLQTAAVASIPEIVDPDPDRAVMRRQLWLLEEGCQRLETVDDYTATFFKQERLGDDLTDGDVTKLKVRHNPFSVYMKWLEGQAGQELLYVDGANNGKMLIKQVGWKARLMPVLSLEPDCVLAMSRSRYPVTQAGLLPLVRKLIIDRRRDLDEKLDFQCQVFEDEVCHDRPCYRFVLEYASPEVSPTYRKSDLFIDKDYCLPIEITNFTWPEEDWGDAWGCVEMDDATLIEYYSYRDLKLDAKLPELDFDRANREYGFQ